MTNRMKLDPGSDKPAEKREPPVRPAQDECCQRGCQPCIFDYHDIALKRWLAENQTLKPSRLS